jgi:hypothetical protein
LEAGWLQPPTACLSPAPFQVLFLVLYPHGVIMRTRHSWRVPAFGPFLALALGLASCVSPEAAGADQDPPLPTVIAADDPRIVFTGRAVDAKPMPKKHLLVLPVANHRFRGAQGR